MFDIQPGFIPSSSSSASLGLQDGKMDDSAAVFFMKGFSREKANRYSTHPGVGSW